MEKTAILRKILQADREGRRACEEALEEKEEFLRSRDKLRRQAEEEAMARAGEEITDARERADSTAEEALHALEEKQECRLRELRRRCEAGMEQWAESLFRMVVGLDD